MEVDLGVFVGVKHHYIRAEARGRTVVQLVASVCQVFGHFEVLLGEPMEIAKSQHPWSKAGQVVHSRTEATGLGGRELCQKCHVVRMGILDKLCHYCICRLAVPALYPVAQQDTLTKYLT